MDHTHAFIHPSAVIDDGAEIGQGSSVWHFSHIMGGASIGEACTLGQNVFVAAGVRIGDGCKVQNNVSIYEGVTIEDHVFCGPSAVFTNVRLPRCEFPQRGSEHYVPTLVRRGASIGANATVVCGVTLGLRSMVAAGAVVTKDVPAYALVAGTPARFMGWVSASGDRMDFQGGARFTDSVGHLYEQTGEMVVHRLDPPD